MLTLTIIDSPLEKVKDQFKLIFESFSLPAADSNIIMRSSDVPTAPPPIIPTSSPTERFERIAEAATPAICDGLWKS